MKVYQRVLINAHSKVDKLGWLNSGLGLFLYSNLYFAYKRYLEGRGLIKNISHLKNGNSVFSHTSLVIDVGAHIGFFTREAVRHFPGVTVIAIEPPGRNSSNFKTLNAKKIDSGVVQFHNVAAWSFNGQIPFHFEDSNTANNRFDSTSATNVPCVTIDSLMRQTLPACLILKIDVQGFEFEVLEGALETLKNHQVALLIELDEGALQARGKSSVELCLKLRNLGFFAKEIKGGGEITSEKIHSMLQKKDCLDFLFVPKIQQRLYKN
jgi:FkbM family methyltransferase